MKQIAGYAAAALMLLATPAAAQDGKTVHRNNAGALDATGWTDASSTEGAYSLRIPCLYEDYSAIPTRPAAPEIEAPVSVYIVACKRSDGATFDVLRIQSRDMAGAEKLFGQLVAISEAPEADQRRFTFKGAQAIDVKLPVQEGQCTMTRVIRAGTDNVVAVAGRPAATCDKLEGDAAKFFDSLEVKSR